MIAVVGAVLGAMLIGAGYLWLPDSVVENGVRLVTGVWERLGDHPFLLYVLMVVLPAFAVPQSPFLVLAGMVYAETFGEGLGAAIAASAVGLNIVVSYFLTVGPLHFFVEKVLSKFGYRVPQIPAEDQLKFSFLVRVTPVFPLCVQNYILGLLKVPLGRYLLASWTTQVPLAFAIALTAGAILEGSLIYILIAVAVLLFLVIGLKWLRKRLQKDPEMRRADEQLGVDGVVDEGVPE